MGCEKPLPDHTKLHYEECYVKIVLENVVSESFKDLEIKDTPDLQFSDGSKGIEVTYAIDENQMNAEKLYSMILHGLSRNEEGAKKAIKECGCDYNQGIFTSKLGTDSFKLVLDALKKKLEIINKGGYAIFNEYDLFILSDIYLNIEMRQEALESMVKISKEYKTIFNQILVLVPGQLYIFNLKTQECQEKNITSQSQYQMACLARKMVENA